MGWRQPQADRNLLSADDCRCLQHASKISHALHPEGATDCKPLGAPADPVLELLIRALIFGLELDVMEKGISEGIQLDLYCCLKNNGFS